VIWLGEDLEDVLVPGGTAAVFGRAAADRFEQKDIRRPVRARRDLLQLDGVGPVVAEVVDVPERLAASIGQRGVEAACLGVQRSLVEAVRVGFAPTGVTDTDLVERELLQPMTAWITRCSRSRRMFAGTMKRRSTRGSTSSRVILRTATEDVGMGAP
jgi:hypothetical protein